MKYNLSERDQARKDEKKFIKYISRVIKTTEECIKSGKSEEKCFKQANKTCMKKYGKEIMPKDDPDQNSKDEKIINMKDFDSLF